MGIPKESASFLLSLFGICGMIGRLLNGLLADHPKVQYYIIRIVCFTKNIYFLYLKD